MTDKPETTGWDRECVKCGYKWRHDGSIECPRCEQPKTTEALVPDILDFVDSQEEYARLHDAAENVAIAYGMGWDLDGVMDVLRKALQRKEDNV